MEFMIVTTLKEMERWASTLRGKHLGVAASSNPRASADWIEEHACAVAKDNSPDYVPARSVRSPEDFALGKIFVDIKTKNLEREFSMPNLISVDRASKLLRDRECDIWYWMIHYKDAYGIDLVSSDVVPIWHLNWDALSIQNLGLGQIQISDWNTLIDPDPDRALWLKELHIRTILFYKRLRDKLDKRIKSIEAIV
jgi:hypothetical protein